MQVGHLLAVLPVQVRIYGLTLNGTWANKSNLDDYVVKLARPSRGNVFI